MTISDYMREAVRVIDEQFGEGFAKKNPALVGVFIQASAQDFHTTMMKVAAQDLGTYLDNVSTAIDAIATVMSEAD